MAEARVDISQARWDQSTFLGRLKHFFWVTDYRTVLTPNSKLEESKVLLEQYRNGEEPPGVTEEDIWYAKKLFESAFHPDSGDLQNVIGRMSFQVPGGMLITAGMMQFYRSNTAVVLWQWINQSFNALVNYTNRNAASDLTTKQMAVAYVSATSCALVTALGLKATLAKKASPLMQRFVPFAAVAAANMVNIPLTRQSEVMDGVQCRDANGNEITRSKTAAAKGISQVVFSRNVIATPGMVGLPFIMEALEKRPWFARYPVMHMPFQTFMLGCVLTFMVPIGCALFPQKCSIKTDSLKLWEKDAFEDIKKQFGENYPDVLYFNKGL